MQCHDRESTTSEEINAAIDSILEEDRQEKLAKGRKRKLYDWQRCEEPRERDRTKKRNYPKQQPCSNSRHIGVNQSKRFSLRVMEAIRAIERQKESNCTTTCEIVDYVKCNFESDGDVDAQVRTALKRTCCEGFVKNEGNDTYSLVGPFACQLTKTQKANANKSMSNESRCGRKQERSPRRRSPGCCRRKNATNTKKYSDTELSIPTTVEEDLNLQRVMTNLQRNEALDRSFERRTRSPRKNLNFDNSCTVGVASNRSTPRQRSSAREENDLLAATRDLDIDFEGNDDDESVEEAAAAAEVQPEDADDDDVASDDSALHEIRGNDEARAQLPNADRDRELKRWIRNCRKECEQRHSRGELNIPD